MPHPFFLLLLCLSSAYRIVAVRCRKFPAWCEQRQHLYSTLGSFNSSSGARCPAYDVRDNLPSARQNRLKNGKLNSPTFHTKNRSIFFFELQVF